MSSHYETKQPLSPELIEKIIKRLAFKVDQRLLGVDVFYSRYVNVGLFYLRQLFFAKFDLKVHTDQGNAIQYPSSTNLMFKINLESADYTNLWNSLREKISLVKSGKPCPGQGTFGHITGGYDAGYYGLIHSMTSW
jgi:Zn-dependent oligopeptidase